MIKTIHYKEGYSKHRFIYYKFAPEQQFEDLLSENAAQKDAEAIDEEKDQFHPEDIKRIERKEITTKQLADEIRKLQNTAKSELDDLKKTGKDESEIEMYKLGLEKKLKTDQISTKELGAIIDEIRELPEKMEQDKKKLGIEHPAIQKEIKDIETQIKNPETTRWIGTKQTESFLDWMRAAMKADPSVKNARKIKFDLENHSSNGLKPRRDFYQKKLDPKLKKYGLTLDDAPHFQREGLSEREKAFKGITDAENDIRKMRQAGLYTLDSEKQIIKQLFKCKNQGELEERTNKIKTVIRKESEQYTNMDNSIFTQTTVNVHGMKLRAMSPKSIKFFLDSYKKYDLNTRADTVINWEKIAENEGKLITELGEVYKDDKEGFVKAFAGFELMDYQQKQKAIESHKELVKHNNIETIHKSNELTAKSLSEIDEKEGSKILSSKSARHFREWVLDNKKYIDPKTKKIDLKKQEKLHKDMTSKTPIYASNNRNIKAYEIGKHKFNKFFKKFVNDNPNMDSSEVEDWRTEYDEGGYTQRKNLYKKLKDKAAEMEKERTDQRVKEKGLGLNSKDIQRMERLAPQRNLVIQACKIAKESAEKEGDEESLELVKDALNMIYAHQMYSGVSIQKDPELKEMRDSLENHQVKSENSLGKEPEIDQSKEVEMAEDVKATIESDQNLKKDVDELDVMETVDDLTEKSEDQYGREVDAKERSIKVAKSGEEDELVSDIIETYEDQTDEDKRLTEEGTGGEVTQAETTGEYEKSEIYKIRQTALGEQARDHANIQQGSTSFERTKNGRTLERHERDKDREQSREEIINDIMDQVNNKEADKKSVKGSDFSNLASRMAARRLAEKEVDRRTKSTLERT